MHTSVYFACADDGIGRFDRSMLSQQDLMELFIFELNEPEKICGNRDDLADVCEWKGVTCSADKDIEKFLWINKKEDGTGTLGFEFLPWSMKIVKMCRNALSGTIQLADLPRKMEVLSLANNKLTSSLDLDGLPHAFQRLYLRENEFSNCAIKTNKQNKTNLPTKRTPLRGGLDQYPSFGGSQEPFSNPSSCFCHGADPIDGHRKVVGQDQYPALGEVQETAKLLPRGESLWWRDEGRRLLILCCFNPRDEISPHE